MPDLKLLAIAQELRDRAEEALTRAETFHDPDCKRLMRQIAASYEDVARRLEREANAADKGSGAEGLFRTGGVPPAPPLKAEGLDDEIRRAREQAQVLSEEARVLMEHTDERAAAANEHAKKARERLEELLRREADTKGDGE